MLVRLHVLRGMLAGDVARSLPELQACPGNPRSTGALRLSSRDATREVLGTERLCLRRFTHADADFVLRLLNEQTFIDNIGDRGVRTQDDARRYLEAGPFASYATYGFGLWLIESKLDGAPIGMCGFLQRDTLPNVDIGYALLPEFAGLGLAREAAMATLAYGKQMYELKKILAIVSPSNARSIRLLERLDFVYDRMMQLTPDAPEVCLYAHIA